jgi:hypothetical protein
MSGGCPGLPFISWQPHPFLKIPAVQAVLIQVVSFACVMMAAYGLVAGWGKHLNIFEAALLQAMCAAILTKIRRLAFWWLIIQAVFPLALLATLSFRLSPTIFLVLFLAFLGLYWSTFRTQVPFYPSSPATWGAVLAELPVDRPIRLVDIGSGLGGLILRLADARPDSRFVGIELAPFPWIVSALRKRFRRSTAQFLRGDYRQLDFASQDVVFAYLSPVAMPALWEKARTEMRKGALLLSFEFDIPGVEPHFVRMPGRGGPALYGWRM